jgi:hypothetical protein
VRRIAAKRCCPGSTPHDLTRANHDPRCNARRGTASAYSAYCSTSNRDFGSFLTNIC